MEPKDLILPAALALGGFFVVRTVMSRRAEAAAVFPPSGGGKEMPTGGGSRPSGGGSRSPSPREHTPWVPTSEDQMLGARIQESLNSIRNIVWSEIGAAQIRRWYPGAPAQFPWERLAEDNVVGPRTVNAYMRNFRVYMTDGRNDGNLIPSSWPELAQNTRNLSAVAQKLTQLLTLLSNSRQARRKLAYLLTPRGMATTASEAY